MTSTGDITGTSIAARTDAGMLALWNPARFSAIADYQAWEKPCSKTMTSHSTSTPANWYRSTSGATEHSGS